MTPDDIAARMVEAGNRTPLQHAAAMVIGTQFASAYLISLVQSISRDAAEDLLQQLQELGVVGPVPQVGRTRPVLVRSERLDEVLEQIATSATRKDSA